MYNMVNICDQIHTPTHSYTHTRWCAVDGKVWEHQYCRTAKEKWMEKKNNNIIKVKETKLKFRMLCSCDKCVFEWRLHKRQHHQYQLWFSKLKSKSQQFDYKRRWSPFTAYNKTHVESLSYLLTFILHDSRYMRFANDFHIELTEYRGTTHVLNTFHHHR